jgi:hypothetical protein
MIMYWQQTRITPARYGLCGDNQARQPCGRAGFPGKQPGFLTKFAVVLSGSPARLPPDQFGVDE